MANSKISVENLNLHYGENHALKDVNMEIADHAITAFIGPSGCGKSTFLRCLNRMNDLVDGCRVEGKVILDMQRSIEAMCLSLLTRQQPVARDMRLVSAALKVVPDIERIGDHVADIVELYLRMGNMNPEGKQEHLLLEMMEEAKEMIHNSVEAFVEGDEANARKVVEHDDVVDDLFNEVKTEMMQAIREQNLDADRVVDYLMMAKYLEKVGDHAVNIAEWAIFRMTGDMEGARLY